MLRFDRNQQNSVKQLFFHYYTGSLGLVLWDDPEGWYREGSGGGGGSGLGTRVHLWRIHVDVWQNQYNTVK